jgi:hypothetical protein
METINFIAMVNFIVVLVFNIWLASEERENYFGLYKWSESGWFSVSLIVYNVWGIMDLIYACI